MKVLLLNAYDTRGGAARAVYRLHRGLREIGVASYMLVQSKASDEAYVLGPLSKWSRLMATIRPQLDILPTYLYRHRKPVIYFPGLVSTPYGRLKNVHMDVAHLHWVAHGFLNPKALTKLRAPLIWTLHDMWPFTGGCHYDNDCGRYAAACGRCPTLQSQRDFDLSRFVWEQKKRWWRGLELTLVAPSRWMADLARRSALFKDRRIEVIPNGIDLSIYRPLNKRLARELLNLPLDKQIILFGALGATGDSRKGFRYVKEAIPVFQELRNGAGDCVIVIFGATRQDSTPEFQIKTFYTGVLHDDLTLALVYSAADVFVAPSIQDNLPNTVLEAMACGTPCVAFQIGGMVDLIEHKQNGYLAKPLDPADLACGLDWVLGDRQRWSGLSKRARTKTEAEFELRHIARRYLTLYREVVW